MADIRDVIAALQPEVRKAFIEAIRDIRSEARLSVLVRALDEGRIDDAIRALHLDDAFFAPLDDALTAAWLQGGRDALRGLPAIADPFPVAALLFGSMVEDTSPKNTRDTREA